MTLFFTLLQGARHGGRPLRSAGGYADDMGKSTLTTIRDLARLQRAAAKDPSSASNRTGFIRRAQSAVDKREHQTRRTGR